MTQAMFDRLNMVPTVLKHLGYTSPTYAITAFNIGAVQNLPITAEDIRRYIKLYGEPNLDSVGKFHHPKTGKIPIDLSLKDREMSLWADFIYIEGDVFLLITSSPTYFSFLHPLGGTGARGAAVAEKKLAETFSHIRSNDWTPKFFICDPESAFKANKSKIENEGITFYGLPKNEHPYLSDIKCRIIKERFRLAKYHIEFNLSRMMSHWLAVWCNSMINMNPTKHNANHESPYVQFYGRKPQYDTHCALSFGDFAMVSDPSSTTRNTSRIRAFPGIALYPSLVTGEWYFFNLETLSDTPLLRARYEPYNAIPKQYLKPLNDLARDDPPKRSNHVTLEDSIYFNSPEPDLEDLRETQPLIQNLESPAHSPIELPDGNIVFNKLDTDLAVYTIQYNVKEGMRKFGNRGKDAIRIQLKAIMDKETFEGVYRRNLTREEAEFIIRNLTIMTEKDDGTIKARICGRGMRPQGRDN